LREAAQQALEALESSRMFVTSREKIKHPEGTEWYDERITALRAALTEPERKPLTDEEIALIVGECAASAHRHDDFSFARAIERAHGIGGEE
jgi:hypothetical protein